MLPAVPVKRISLSKSTRVILITLLWQAKLLSRTAGQNWPLAGDRSVWVTNIVTQPQRRKKTLHFLESSIPSSERSVRHDAIILRRPHEFVTSSSPASAL